MAITNAQIQAFVDSRIRPHCGLARALTIIFDDDIACIDDVYAAMIDSGNTWEDTPRNGAPPHLMSKEDVLAINSFMHNVRDFIKNDDNYEIMLKVCSQPILG